MIKGIIFDMDGVLVKTLHIAERIAREKLSEHNIDLTDKDITYLAEFSWKEFLEYIYKSRKIAPIQGIYEDILNTYSVVLPNEVTVYEGANELLANLSANFKLALVSGSSKNDIITNLKKFRIKKYFRIIMSAQEVEKGKPAPDLYLIACKKLNLKPNECIGIEDSVLGVDSVTKARMKCIAITHTVPSNKLKKADKIIASLHDVISSIKSIQASSR